MSPSFWRSIYDLTGANPVPLNPEKDPYDVIAQLRANASADMAWVQLTQPLSTTNTKTRVAYGTETQDRLAGQFRKSPNLTANLNQFTLEILQLTWRTVISKTRTLADIVDLGPARVDVLGQDYGPASNLSVMAQKEKPQTVTKGATDLKAQIMLKSTVEYIRLMRRKSLHLRNNVYTPFRRRVTDASNFIYLVATLVFANEHIRRAYFDGGAETSNYRDFIYFVSFILVAVLFISAIRSIPWGVRFDETFDIQT